MALKVATPRSAGRQKSANSSSGSIARTGTAAGRRFGVPLRGLLLLSILCTSATVSSAADSHEAFLSGLRQRGYFDTALEYLSQLEQSPDTPDTVRSALDLERAIIWKERGAAARRQDDRQQFTGRARAMFESFLRDHPQHERAASAHAQLGRLLFDQARQQIWASNAAGTAEQRQQQLDEARERLQQARQSFGQARDLFKSRLDSLPFVDREDDEKAFEHRRRTEARYLSAWLNLINCIYEDALITSADGQRRTNLLTSALEQYEQIHTFSRASAAGQHAKLMMGKCRQELGDISEALGYFDELRNQPSQDPYMQRLSRTAQYYRLICLNHESRREYQNVVSEATRWLRAHQQERNTEAGLGILFEKSVASEALARDEELSEEQRELRLRQTLAGLDLVSAVVSPVQQPARVAARQIRDELGEARRDPVKFDTAFDRGRELVGQLQEARDAVQKATTDEQREQAEQELELLTTEAGRMFRLALQLRESDSDPVAVAQARYLLSYVYLQQRKSFDAFVLARDVMRHHAKEAAETAADATEMAISAALQIWADAPEDDRTFELGLVREICAEIIRTFPGSRRATEARMRLGRIWLDLDQPVQAAEAFLQVPKEDAGYAAARVEAGQAWWLAWAQAGNRAADDPDNAVDPETLASWKDQARQLLEEGIQLAREARTGDELSDEVIRAEVSLSGLLNQDGAFAETVERLAGGRPSVISAISTDEPRPERGVRSAAFAGLCYRTLLRAYVGTQQIDEALDIMQQLQTLGAANTTAIYTQLGRELQQELKRLETAGESDRLQSVRRSFEEFLQQVYQSRDPSNVGALLWIGETYAGLAAGPGDGNGSLSKAATVFEELLKAGPDETTAMAVRLRLIRVYRQLKQFRAAVDLGTTVLTERPTSVSVQLEVAHSLADWGEGGEPQRLLDSISGLPAEQQDRPVWGWAGLARRLQRSQGQENWADLKPVFLEARYELSNSRLRYARVNPDQGSRQLEAAAREVTSLVQVLSDLDETWWERFNQLYQDIQTQLGRPGLALTKPGVRPGDITSDAGSEQTDDSASDSADQSPTVSASPSAPSGSAGSRRPAMTWLFAGLGVMAAGVSIITFLVMRRPRKRVKRPMSMEPSEFQVPTGVPSSSPAPARRRSASSTAERSRSQSTARPAGERKKRPRPDAGKTPSDAPAPRKRRRPPSPPADSE